VPDPVSDGRGPLDRFRRLLFDRSVLVLSGLLLLGVAATLWHLARLSRQLVNSAALQGVSLQSDSLAEVRTLYTQDVVERVRSHGIDIAHDYMDRDKAIPLPATFSIELARRIGAHGTGMQVRLYSDFPFPWRKDGGARDAFERDALVALRQNPDQAFYRLETVGGIPSLRYARADRMRASCIDCHNSRADSPKRDWKVGDVRGVLEIVRPLDRVVAETNAGLRETFFMLSAMAGLGMLGLALVVAKLRRNSQELEVRVVQRTAELAEANRDLIDEVGRRRQAEADLAVARDAALLAARSKAQFLANMSHEIRTPLNGILGMTGLLQRTRLAGEQRDFARAIHSCGETLLALVNDVLDFSKGEAGRVVLETLDFELRDVVEDALVPIAARAREKGVELASLVYRDVPTALRGDPGRLRQVITNLVGNGVKFTERGEVVVRVTRVAETDTGVTVRVAVTDTGIGITPQQQKELFQAFSQADGSTTRKYGGTGLGLAISKQLVEAMGGEVGLESAEGEGSTFWFTVPFLKQPPRPPTPPTPEIYGTRVLVVDDNQTNRTILHHQLTSWGVREESVPGARQALERLRAEAASGDPYRLVVLDMQMPEMDGLALARTIADDPRLADVLLIMLTSIGTQQDVPALRAARIAACLTKPVRQSELYDCLADVLSGRERLAAAPAAGAPSRAARRGRVLVAEDNAVNREVAVNLLQEIGFDSEVVGNGREAVAAAARGGFDAILMDCQMPEMDGYAATAEIRKSEGGGRRTPIIAMTAHALAGDRERCIAAGMDDYVSKPIPVDGLETVLLRWIRPPEAASPSAPAASPTVASADGDPPVDVRRLQRVSRGDHRRITALFFEEAAGHVRSLEEALDGGHADAARRAAHTLAGAAANLGFGPLAAILREIEQKARGGNLIGAPELLPVAKAELARARLFLETQFP
jgi:signal transduction histidine kinase/CheY-like chemotaxis protein